MGLSLSMGLITPCELRLPQGRSPGPSDGLLFLSVYIPPATFGTSRNFCTKECPAPLAVLQIAGDCCILNVPELTQVSSQCISQPWTNDLILG